MCCPLPAQDGKELPTEAGVPPGPQGLRVCPPAWLSSLLSMDVSSWSRATAVSAHLKCNPFSAPGRLTGRSLVIAAHGWCFEALPVLLLWKQAPTGTGTAALALLMRSDESKVWGWEQEHPVVWMCPEDCRQTQQWLCWGVVAMGPKLEVWRNLREENLSSGMGKGWRTIKQDCEGVTEMTG